MRLAVILQCGRFKLSLAEPLIMGVVNATPDSFSGDAELPSASELIKNAQRLVREGADLLDIGAESTRPGAQPVPLAEELARLSAVIGPLLELGVPISVDTRKPAVMRAVLAAGVDMINDVNGFRDPDAVVAVRDSACGCCVMHMQGDPLTMQAAPAYRDVVAEVGQFFYDQTHLLLANGVDRERLVLDPGFGFGKAFEHNVALMRHLPETLRLVGALPLLVGVSRKRMIGELTGRPVQERAAGSVAAALYAVQHGAQVVRVHDVAQTRDALSVWRGLALAGFEASPSAGSQAA